MTAASMIRETVRYFKNGQTKLQELPVSVAWVWGNTVRVRVGETETFVSVRISPEESRLFEAGGVKVSVKGSRASLAVHLKGLSDEVRFVSLLVQEPDAAASLFRQHGTWMRPSGFYLDAMIGDEGNYSSSSPSVSSRSS